MHEISSMMPQMYENVTNNLPSSEIPVVHLFTSYFSLTCSSLCSCEPPPANCLFVFCYFSSSSYGTFNYYFSYPSVLVLFFLFLLILFLLLSFIILCNPGNSVHFTPFPDTCVCAVCVCVCLHVNGSSSRLPLGTVCFLSQTTGLRTS